MKKTFASLFALCVFGISQAQTFDDIVLKNRYVDCRDVNYNAPGLVRSLREKNEIDSLYSFLDYWQGKCGTLDYIQSMRLLLDIKTANFDSTTVDGALFNTLISYKQIYPHYHSWHPVFVDYFNPMHRDSQQEYNQLQLLLQNETRKIASDIQATYSTDEALLQDFYAADSVSFAKIKQSSPKDSKLRRLYDKELAKTLRMPEFHAALFAGYYHPFGKLDVFGPHPSVGAIFGARQLRHNYDLVLDVRFGRSQENYEFVYQGDLMEDDRWTSFYFGFEYTYDFIATKKFRMGLSPGIAYNGITAVNEDDTDDDDAKILPSLDVNGGLALKYTFGKNGGYAGLQARYHWVDHRNPGGTELDGNYLSLRLIFGSIFNYDREYRLRQLD
jgi:hypothetical protein